MNNTSRLIPAFAGLVVIALVGALLLGVLPGGGLFGAPTPVLIEDFESGTLDGWLLDCRGHGCWYPYDDGATSPLVGEASDPENPFAMPDPPQGEFAAATDTAAEGTRILYRDLELAGRQELHLTVYYENPFGVFYRVPELSHDGITPTQLYRIDVMDPSAPVDSLAEGDILATIFLTEPGDPPSLPPTEITFDLSPWAGQTVRLRLVNVDNFGPMRAGVDNIYLERVR